MARTIFIEVQVDEVDRIDPGYMSDPKTVYELTPLDSDLDGSIEFTCRRSQLIHKLNRLDKRGAIQNRGGLTSRAIYGEPEEEAGVLVRDAAHKLLSGFNIPALDAIVDSLEEAVMPDRVRQRRKVNNKTEEEVDE